MASAYIVARSKSKAGDHRFAVRYRLGGAESPVLHGGSFSDPSSKRARALAEARRRVIEDALSRGVLPDLDLAGKQRARRTVLEAAEAFVDSRADASPATIKIYRQAIRTLGGLGALQVDAVTIEDIRAWVKSTSATRKPSTTRKYLDVLRSIFDDAGREAPDNPARSKKVRVPKAKPEEIVPPSFDHVMAILETVSPKYRLHVDILEATGVRISELLGLRWGVMDFLTGGFLVAHGETKGNTKGRRFVPLPPHLLSAIDALLPVEDRDPSARIFEGTDQSVRLAIGRACKFARIPHFSPHDFRHRWISLRFEARWSDTRIAEGAGQGMKSVTREVYAHVLRDEPLWLLRALEMQARGGPVVSSTSPMMSENEERPANASLSV